MCTHAPSPPPTSASSLAPAHKMINEKNNEMTLTLYLAHTLIPTQTHTQSRARARQFTNKLLEAEDTERSSAQTHHHWQCGDVIVTQPPATASTRRNRTTASQTEKMIAKQRSGSDGKNCNHRTIDTLDVTVFTIEHTYSLSAERTMANGWMVIPYRWLPLLMLMLMKMTIKKIASDTRRKDCPPISHLSFFASKPKRNETRRKHLEVFGTTTIDERSIILIQRSLRM